MGHFFILFLHKPRSSQALEPLSWDLEPRYSRFEALNHWVEIEPLSHDPTKPSHDQSSSKDLSQAIKPLSWDSSQDPSFSAFVAVFLFLKPNSSPSQATPWVLGGMLKTIAWIKRFICDLWVNMSYSLCSLYKRHIILL